MTKQEAIQIIEAKVKPYHEVGIPQSTYWTTINRIKKGSCSPKTTAKFFKRFNLILTKEEYEYEKV